MTEIKENNMSSRILQLGYLRHRWKTIARLNENGEYEIIPSKYCKVDDIVWVLEDDNTFTKTKIY